MTSNKKAEDLHQAVHELKSLNKLALTISSTTDVDGIIKTIIQEATNLTGASQGSILLTKEESEPKFTTLIRKGTKKYESAVQKICMVIAGWILKHREALMVDNIRAFTSLISDNWPRAASTVSPCRRMALIILATS